MSISVLKHGVVLRWSSLWTEIRCALVRIWYVIFTGVVYGKSVRKVLQTKTA